jgi:acetyl-CoA C-acetyltransferase/potassium large conductance calcium-activated channel subfamily M alpha protein 1
MNLLAKSCICPGIISLISMLITSAADQASERFEYEWLKEFSIKIKFC